MIGFGVNSPRIVGLDAGINQSSRTARRSASASGSNTF